MASVIMICDCCEYEQEWDASNQDWIDFQEIWELHQSIQRKERAKRDGKQTKTSSTTRAKKETTKRGKPLDKTVTRKRTTKKTIIKD